MRPKTYDPSLYEPAPPKPLPYELDLLPYHFSKLVGIPCVKGGRDRLGVDCWGLFVLAYKEIYDIDLPHHSDKYTDDMDRLTAQKAIAENCRDDWFLIPKEEARQGDGLLMYSLGAAMHIGLVVGGRRMLHVEARGSSIIEEYTSIKVWPRIVSAYRYDPPR